MSQRISRDRRRRGRGGGSRSDTTLPWWLPGGLFLLATVVLFGEFIFSDRMLYGGDSLSLGYMARAYFAERLAVGDFPLWSPRLLGGIPFVEALSAGDSIYPTSLLYFIVEPYRALGWKLVLHILAGGFFMYGWARSLGLGRPAATIGGLAWLMAPVIVTLVLPGNDGKLMVATLAPLVFWAADSVFRAPSARTVAGMAGAVALTSLTTQFQTAYFLFGSVGAYAVFRSACLYRAGTEHRRARSPRRALVPLGLFLGGALLGAGMAAVQILPAMKYVTESSRRTLTTVDASAEDAIAYSSSWSLHPEEVMGLAIPEFAGNSNADAEWATGTYWGRNAFKLNHEYVGVTVLVLALFGLFGKRRRGLRWFMAGLSVLWLLFALGTHTPVWRILYEVVPGISLFRVPSLSAFLVSFAVTTLLALGVDDLVSESPSRDAFLRTTRGRALLGFLGLLLVGLLLQSSGALGSIWTTMIHPGADERSIAILAAARPFITLGFGIAFVLAALTVAAAWALLERRIPVTAALAALAVLVAADLGRIDRAFITTLDFHAWAAPDGNVRFLQDRRAEEAPFRVADLRDDDQNVDLAMFGIDLVTGHHPNDLARYRQLLGLAGSRRQGTNTRNATVLRMLNVKYLVWPEERAGQPPMAGARPLSTARTAAGTEAVYAFPGLDRAWLAGTATVMDDSAALDRILAPGFDPRGEVIVAEPVRLVPAPGVTGAVVWEVDEPDHRRLGVRTTGPALLVVSENWFPGWVAEVNGEPAAVHRANLTLQAIEIPAAGDHTVTLRFTAPTVRSALRLSLAAAAITVLLLAASLLPHRFLPWRTRNGASQGG